MRRVTRNLPWVALTAGVVANGLRLRARVARLPVLDDAPTELVAVRADYGVITGTGVEIDDVTRTAAIGHAHERGLDVLDLVPGDLHLDRLYELARLVNPKTYRQDRMAAGRGAGHATLVRHALLDEIGLREGRPLDPVEYVEAMAELKRYAPTTTDLVVAPGLRALSLAPEWRFPRLRAVYGGTGSVLGVLPILQTAALTAGAAASRGRSLPALAATVAQPFLVGTGGPVRPTDLTPTGGLGRVGRDLRATAQSLRTPPPAAVRHRAEQAAADDETRRAQYARLLQRTAAFFEPRVAECPWCGGDDLQLRVEVPDLLQGKPGRFRLDQCADCGHVFQNPRLSIEGLDFYYRDFYDGLGHEETAFIFSMNRASYRGRAKMLQAVARPKRWLDVGAGHGHFCLEAQEIWPETTFDGLDLSGSVITAERRGWIDRAYKGLFPDLAPDLVGAYDVVSMHHYLEHTRDPAAELDAAYLALEDGGHLLIEVPDPECRIGRVLRGAWGPWFQPQHQHLVPFGNLGAALGERGFTMVKTEQGPAHQPLDLAFAVWLTFNRLAPGADRPWNPRPTVATRAGRTAAWAVTAPLLAGALLTDHAVAPMLRRLPRTSNTYRVLARKA